MLYLRVRRFVAYALFLAALAFIALQFFFGYTFAACAETPAQYADRMAALPGIVTAKAASLTECHDIVIIIPRDGPWGHVAFVDQQTCTVGLTGITMSKSFAVVMANDLSGDCV